MEVRELCYMLAYFISFGWDTFLTHIKSWYLIFIVLLKGLENVWRTWRQSARFLKARRAKINKLLSQKQIGDWSEIFNKSLSQNCIGETKQKFMQTILGSSEPIEINLKLTKSKRNAHFIFYKHFIFCGNIRGSNSNSLINWWDISHLNLCMFNCSLPHQKQE